MCTRTVAKCLVQGPKNTDLPGLHYVDSSNAEVLRGYHSSKSDATWSPNALSIRTVVADQHTARFSRCRCYHIYPQTRGYTVHDLP